MDSTSTEVLVAELIIQETEPSDHSCLWGDLTDSNSTPYEQTKK